jgi:formamidopyrimidine-DNA glycosylase
MVELPESLLIANQIDNELKGKMVKNVVVNNTSPKTLFVYPSIDLLEPNLKDAKITCSFAKGKWIFIEFDNNLLVSTAPEMGAEILYHTAEESLPKKHHFLFEFTDDTYLTLKYSGFLLLRVGSMEEQEEAKYPGKIGPTPIDDEFDERAYLELLEVKSMIKSKLLEGTNLPGVSNYYLNEALYRAKIHPKRKANTVTKEEKLALLNEIKCVLKDAISKGGRSERVDLHGNPGKYNRTIGPKEKDTPCKACGTLIEKISVGGTNSYICPQCQPLE